MRTPLRSAARLTLALVACAVAAAPVRAQAPRQEPIRYGRDVRPILADRCFRCHGPDAGTREAKLRLDSRDEALAARDDGAAIVPGEPQKSLLWQRITHQDEGERMPPKKSGKPTLTAAEVEIVERWIREGAPYEPHWAFQVPQHPQVPQPQPTWAKNPIDTFVFARLANAGLQPSPPADRATLARRVFLVLTGLPPTPGELDAFLADTTDDAYERLVEKLFGEEPYRTRHAEHLAQPWLDAARYADTSGIHMDAGRQIWPWRDWLINSLRDDLPFDRFVVEQLAGDLLPGATQAQRTASGFLRNHVTTDEGGAIDEEYRVEYAAERTATVGSVFLGLTVGCARCHDHKYDPISQEDYYRLYSFFNSNQEPGLYEQSPNANRALEPFLEVPSSAQVEEQRALQQQIDASKLALEQEAPGETAERTAFFAALQKESGITWPAVKVTAAESRDGATLTVQPDGSVLASGKNPARDVHTLTLRTEGRKLRLLCLEALTDPSLPEGKVGRSPNGNAVLDCVKLAVRKAGSKEPFTPVRLVWATADVEQQNGDFQVVNALQDDQRGWAVDAHGRPPSSRTALFLAESPFGSSRESEVQVTLEYDSQYDQHVFGRVRIWLGTLAEPMLDRLPVATSGFYVAGPFEDADKKALYAKDHGPEAASFIDGKQRWGKIGWRFDESLREATVHDRLPQGSNVTYVAQRVHAPTARDCSLSLGSDDGFQLFVGGKMVKERVVDRAAGKDQDEATFRQPKGDGLLVMKIVNTGGQGGFFLRRKPRDSELQGDMRFALLPPDVQAPLRQRIDLAWRERHSPGFAARRTRVEELTAALAKLAESVPRTMVMQEASSPRETFVLMRGEYDKPDRNRPVARELPHMFGALPKDAPHDRLGLAQFLVSDGNPLVRRVATNRLWEFVFGTGLVRTSEDFGHQGEWPSHPELLDWLATEFAARGHSVRAMLRLMVTSATFRQDSRINLDAKAQDNQGRLLGWFPRRRLTAEAIRDQALYVSGLLVERTGGPSVKPYQPPGLWQEVAMLQSNTRIFTRDSGDALWRRSLYTYWKRACPPPTLLTLDAPTREFCTIRRSTTNTPLQALALWNDEQFVEAARLLAQRTLLQPGTEEQRLQSMHRRCTGQQLDAERLRLAKQLLAKLRTRYAAQPDDAKALLAVGDAPRDKELREPELAAWLLVANAFLNLDATLFID